MRAVKDRGGVPSATTTERSVTSTGTVRHRSTSRPTTTVNRLSLEWRMERRRINGHQRLSPRIAVFLAGGASLPERKDLRSVAALPAGQRKRGHTHPN